MLCVCTAPVAAIRNAHNNEELMLRGILYLLTQRYVYPNFSVSEQLERQWERIEVEVWCITHYAEPNMALYLILATEEIRRAWEVIRKAAVWKCVWRGKGDAQLESTQCWYSIGRSRNLILSVEISSQAHWSHRVVQREHRLLVVDHHRLWVLYPIMTSVVLIDLQRSASGCNTFQLIYALVFSKPAETHILYLISFLILYQCMRSALVSPPLSLRGKVFSATYTRIFHIFFWVGENCLKILRTVTG